MALTKTYRTITIDAAGLTDTLAVDDAIDIYNVYASGGAVALAGNISITASGTPTVQTTYCIRFGGGFTLGAFTCSFFGLSLTTAQCLYEQYIEAVYNGTTWEVSISSDVSNGAKDINGADIVDSTVANAALAGSITLQKLAAAVGRGYILRSGANGVIETSIAKDATQIVGGNGTDVGALTVSGDLTVSSGVFTIANNAVTTAKINANAVTVAKLTTELATLPIILTVSFEAGEQGAYKVPCFFSGSVVSVYAEAVKAIGGTDSGTIIFKNQAGTTMTVTTPIVFAASDPFGTAYTSAVTANNSFVDGDVITVTTAKTTAGGKSLVTMKILRA